MSIGNAYNSSVSSPYLQQPDQVIPIIVQCAEFCKKSYDPVYGGFFTMLGRDGTPKEDGRPNTRNNYKTVYQQSRIAFSFAKAYMVTGNREYLEYAHQGLDFLERYGLDRKNGGFYIITNARGRCIDWAARSWLGLLWGKWSLIQHYGLIGYAAYYEATGDERYLVKLKQFREEINSKLWDTRPGFEGYFECASYKWAKRGGKGFTPTVDAITSHALALVLLTGDRSYHERLITLADEIIEHLVASMDIVKLGFVEYYNSNWKPVSWLNSFMFGHMLKMAWCLGRVHLIHNDERYIRAAEKLLNHVWEKAWDHEYRGPYFSGNNQKGVITSCDKQYWTFEQAVTAGLIGYHITQNPTYLTMADQAIDFFNTKLLDHQYGDAFDKTDRTGATITSDLKGYFYKDIYHTLELQYFVYLYGNLYLQKRPVTLYYYMDAASNDRDLVLNPVEIHGDAVQIQAVLHEGKEYQVFEPGRRILKIPAGVGGEFRVTFEPKD